MSSLCFRFFTIIRHSSSVYHTNVYLYEHSVTSTSRLCVQEYVRLIEPWCQVNIGSCRFMLGQCYLANGEGQKVSRVTERAARGAAPVTRGDIVLWPSGSAMF